MPTTEEIRIKELVEQKMKEALNIIKTSLTKQEFLDSFKNVIKHAKKIEAELKEKIDSKLVMSEEELKELGTEYTGKFEELSELYAEVIKRVEKDNEAGISNLKKWAIEKVSDLFIKSNVNQVLNGKLEEVDGKLKEINDFELPVFVPPDFESLVGEASEKVKSEIVLPVMEEEIPKLGKEVRDGLELLEEDERLKIEAIKDLREELDELKKQIGNKLGGVSGGGGVGKHNTKSYNLSASLDGTTRTFSLPAFYDIVDVKLSSVPLMIEDEDYTVDGSAGTITFTSEITDLDLGSNQRCLVLYSE